MTTHHKPIWDRGEPIDEAILRFTIGDDWRMDQRLVEHDLRGSMAHCEGLLAAGLIEGCDHDAIQSRSANACATPIVAANGRWSRRTRTCTRRWNVTSPT